MDTKSIAIKMARMGYPYHEIASVTGLTYWQVYSTVRKTSLIKRLTSRNSPRGQKGRMAVRLIRKNYRNCQIARITGLTQGRVSQIRSAMNVKRKRPVK